MAKAKGPLLSLGASGKFGNLFEVRAKDGEHNIIPIRRTPGQRSPAQQNQADRFRAASAEWSALTPEQKAIWNAAAEGTGMIGYRLYLSEYMNQGIIPPNQPTIP